MRGIQEATYREKEITIGATRFIKTKFLGEGSYAHVYLAEAVTQAEQADMEPRKVALKIYRPETINRWLNLSTCKRGFELRQRHPDIPAGHLSYPHSGNFDEESLVFAAFDYIEGETALSALPASSASDSTRIQLARTLVELTLPRLEELRLRGLTHRDIKRDNIVIKNSPAESMEAALTDTDLLATVDGENVDDSEHQGNLYNISPEGAAFSASPTMDFYSLAVETASTYLGAKVMKILNIGTPHEKEPEFLRLRACGKGPQDPQVQKKLRRWSWEFPEEVQEKLHGLIEFLIGTLQPHHKDRPQNAEQGLQLLNMKPNIRQI